MNNTLRQWMLDMTGPEDAWAREQYARLVIAAFKAISNCERWSQESHGFVQELRAAMVEAGEEVPSDQSPS